MLFCSQSFTIPYRAFEWAETPELELTILAYFSPTLDFAIVPLEFPLLNQWAEEVTKQVLVSFSFQHPG